ncbi:acyl-coenzyme A thioesterase 9, mitochondrial isoform X1 [Zea mays]|uniref:HotDog ACOT-type domain-containing protein n=1 Tax=Zea mays TaxID=4577 RepID=A0A804MPW5_MAIZE|nr:acyl-coenzyme A thioesterase 9, mitochondrial isoform X1 [Zea mays]|eukprot:XP_008670323.1 acyl-coenzyme A thioesterase 9, mitochondrial [Zea mays]
MTTRLTATLLLSRTLVRRVTSRTPTPLGPFGLEPSAGIPISWSRRASSTASGDRGQEPPPAMDSPIKVVSHLGGGRGGGGGEGEGEGEGGAAAIDAGKSARRPLSLWPGMYHSPVTNALWEARSSIFERMMDAGNGASSAEQRPQTELLVKTPAQSRTSIVYKFATDDILREQYRDPWNEVRIGKLLEDLDALAGTIAVKHCSDEDSTTRPLLVVTASVDKMELKKPIRVDTDLKIAGAVTYVGRSSIDIQIEVTQVDKDGDNQSDPIALTANFTFVARDSKTGKSAPVNRLSPETEREKQLFGESEARDKMRKRKREEQKGGLENGIHRLRAEAERLDVLLAEGRVFSDLPALADRDSILLKDTRLENSLVCQPQQRNLHGRIFGGFLMHRAFELAFSTAYAFVGQRPCFLEVDHVDFLKPVDVGDFLRFKSCVLYTQLDNPEQPLVNVEVVAHVTRPELRKSEVSNTFHFTFTVCSDTLKNGLKIRNVVPSTEEEARRILERMEAEGLCN